MPRIFVATCVTKYGVRLVHTITAPLNTPEEEINETLLELCIFPIAGVVFKTNGRQIWIEEARREAKELIEYAKRKRKRFWCIDNQRQKLSRIHTLENVWSVFRKTPLKED